MIGLQVNAMIAAFNLLPISVLDGRKILAWNPAIFAVMIVAAFGVLLVTFYPYIL
jgi:Zn-dependent protease